MDVAETSDGRNSGWWPRYVWNPTLSKPIMKNYELYFVTMFVSLCIIIKFNKMLNSVNLILNTGVWDNTIIAPVSYTHLDVYKRQVQRVLPLKVRVSDKFVTPIEVRFLLMNYSFFSRK